MKIVTIVGARPQFIKAAAVSRAIAAHNKKVTDRALFIDEFIVHTGQHYDDAMSAVFFRELEIPEPNVNLSVGSGSHGYQTGQMLMRLEEVLLEQKPDWVMVYGDTNSTLAGALAAAKLHIPVAHVEAGLRSFNRDMPEEINRLLTDHVSTLLFCPTQQAVKNLKAEGIFSSESNLEPSALNLEPHRKVLLVGDVMYDSVLHNIKLAEKKSNILEKLNLKPKGYALATVHRAENTDNPEKLESIFSAFNEIARSELSVVVPLHPRTQKALDSTISSQVTRHSSLIIINPVSYLDMLMLEKQAKVILTDSGGVQKEAYWFKVPCVTLRDETEWVETIEAGWNVLAGADADRIGHAVDMFSSREGENSLSLYGDGQAAKQIANHIQKQLFNCQTRCDPTHGSEYFV